jgi:hypothetical protein
MDVGSALFVLRIKSERLGKVLQSQNYLIHKKCTLHDILPLIYTNGIYGFNFKIARIVHLAMIYLHYPTSERQFNIYCCSIITPTCSGAIYTFLQEVVAIFILIIQLPFGS